MGPSSKVINISLVCAPVSCAAAKFAAEVREQKRRQKSRTDAAIFFITTVCAILLFSIEERHFKKIEKILKKLLTSKKKCGILKKTDEVEE